MNTNAFPRTSNRASKTVSRRALSLALMNAIAVMAAAPGLASAATQPTPNTAAITQSNQGADAAPQSAGTGGQPPDLAVTVTGNQVVGDAGNGPAVAISSTGGTGGTGEDGDISNGGTGGRAGLVTLTMDAGSAVVGSGTEAAVISLSSTGGAGNTAGDQLGGDTPGQPGSGGDSNGIVFQQAGSVYSSNGWNGSTPGSTAILMQANGGNAAQPLGDALAEGAKVTGATGGAGGDGGAIDYHLYQGDVTSAGSAIVALSQGGTGGDGTPVYAADAHGGVGGDGGNGGDIQIYTGQNGLAAPTIKAVGAPTAATGVTVPINANGGTAQAAVMAAGIQAQSIGGQAGAGGTADGGYTNAGAGGAAGGAGTVAVGLGSTNITTTGFAAAGVLAQSVGGAGGNGALAGGIWSHGGGSGGVGGNASAVQVGMNEWTLGAPTSLIKTSGNDSMAVVAQSIGGGGGAGGAVQTGSVGVGMAIGGDGESGGTAGSVTLGNGTQANGSDPAQTGFVISTKGTHSSALIAQSVGGGGGTGGSAQTTSIGVLSYAVGGSGGDGGNAGTAGTNQVTVYNNGIVSTVGDHAKGVVGQAVGGGGGDGGSATGQSATNTFNVNVAVGGSGGKGGTAGDVLATNAGQILTSGSDAWGLLGQSVGDGGGNGGMSKAEAYDLATNSEVPTVQIVVGVGGQGGDGANAGNVGAYNTGLIMTSGASAHGVLAQSVSGGGGNGGDSSANSTIIGDGESVTVKVDVGGTGGEGGTGGTVTADNSAGNLIFTAGDSARGIFAQSVGGGGGAGGTGKSDTRFVSRNSNADNAAQLTLTVGGSGGSGSAGGNVTATSEGNILTLGDNGNGIFAQSVGGGGGLAGSATAKGTGGKHTETITVAGTAGSGANGGTVTASNDGNIVTYGGDAAAIYAQSVGGGGGKAGSATTAGLPDTAATLADWLPNSTTLKSHLQTYSGVDALGAGSWNNFDYGSLQSIAADYLAYAAQQPDNLPADSTVGSATVELNIGGGSSGLGATQGDGGEVDVTNRGMLLTSGPLSSGIFAQSVGGGGGDAASTQVQKLQSSGPEAMTGTVTLGGRAANGGDGGAVNVTNVDASISTQGDASFGVFAQSVGGGGGHTAITSSGFASVTGTPTTITMGGDGFTHGNGGDVTVVNERQNDGAYINTGGDDAVAIVAQSIGGGGGDAIVLHTTANANGNGYSVGASDPTIDINGTQTDIQVGGTTPQTQDNLCSGIGDGYSFASCGNGGNVSVTMNTASLNTQGRQAHGILAQSLGGGGGWVTGISYGGSDPFAKVASDSGSGYNYASMGGNAGNVDINVTGDIVTHLSGAYGILAQSVGGGGILGGDLGDFSTPIAFPLQMETDLGPASMRWGQGGDVNVTINGYQLLTKGDNAPAIFAQSVGGGGGLMASTSGLLMGTAGGTGYAGAITINNNGGYIQASGNHSSAIYVNSEGHFDSGSTSDVKVNNTGTIYGVTNAPVIVLSGQHNTNGNGTVTNSGTIASVDTDTNLPAPGTAISVADVDSSESPYIVVNNQAGGKIYGDIEAGDNGKSADNNNDSSINNSGYWAPNASSTAHVVNNNGGTIEFNAGGQAPMAASWIYTNSFNDTKGTLIIPADFENDINPMNVNGMLSLAGTTFVVKPTRLLPEYLDINAVAVTDGNVTARDTGNYLFSYSVADDGEGDVAILPASQLVAQASAQGFGSNLMQTATNLQNNFTTTATDAMAQTYANLSTIGNPGDYMTALESLGSESAQAASAAHLSASQAFVERMNSCPQFDGNDTTLREHDCGWVRVVANQADHDATSNSVGFKQNGQTVQIGGQREVGNDWFVGGSLSYDRSDLDSHAVDGSVDGQGWSAGVVVKHQMGDWLVSGAIDGGRMSYDADRHLLFTGVDRHATSQFDVSHIGLHSRIARQIPFANWYLKPYVDLHATRLESGGYTEQGAGELSLHVAPSNETIFSAAPMLEAGGRFDLASGKQLRVFGGLGGAFYSEGKVGADMQFVEGDPTAGTFHIDTDLPNERMKANAGLDLKASDHLDLRLEYTGEFASHYQDNTAALKVSYDF